MTSYNRRPAPPAATPAERVHILVGEALPLVPWLEPGPLIDVGSGNGSPGLVLAVLGPVEDVTLLEPRQRRWAASSPCRRWRRP